MYPRRVLSLPRSARLLLGAASLGWAIAACTSKTGALSSGAPCEIDSDCAGHQYCKHTSSPSPSPQVVANPCASFVACTTSDTCGAGLVCGPYPGNPLQPMALCPSMVCQAPCTETSCPTDQVCGDDGVCAFVACDQPGAPACAPTFRCDPAAAANATFGTLNGIAGGDGVDDGRAALQGCVRRKCDDGGLECAALWRCDPAHAGDEMSGCVPIPCTESGHCLDDGTYICTPTSSGPHRDITDWYGCVLRNCEEGLTCTYIGANGANFSTCEPTSPSADDSGCVFHDCTERPEACVDPANVCDPADQFANAFGCRVTHCDEPGATVTCSGGSSVCDPGADAHDAYGCRPLDTGTGGSGAGGSSGTGGVGGTGGTLGGAAGQGGAGAAGGAAGGGAGGTSSGTSSSGTSSSGAMAGSAATGMCVERP